MYINKDWGPYSDFTTDYTTDTQRLYTTTTILLEGWGAKATHDRTLGPPLDIPVIIDTSFYGQEVITDDAGDTKS